MSDARQEERISAYLDDELTVAQRQQVERLLADDASASQLFDDLRALSQALRAMPQHRLREDLRGPILQRLKEASVAAQSDPPEPTPAPISIGRSWRAWGWVAATIAAALAISITIKDPDEPRRELAQAPADSVASLSNKPNAEKLKNSRDAPSTAADDEALLASTPSKAAASRSAPVNGWKDERGGEATSRRTGSAKKGGTDLFAEKRVGQHAKSGFDAAAPLSPAAPPPVAAPSPEASERKLAENEGRFGDLRAKLSAEPRLDGALAGSRDELLVVECRIHPASQNLVSFSQTLARNSIAWESRGPSHGQAGAPATRQTEEAGSTAESAQRDELVANLSPTEQPPASDVVDMVYVEATPDQLEQTLVDLAADPNQVLALEVRSAGHGTQSGEPFELQKEQADTSVARGRRAAPDSGDASVQRDAARLEVPESKLQLGQDAGAAVGATKALDSTKRRAGDYVERLQSSIVRAQENSKQEPLADEPSAGAKQQKAPGYQGRAERIPRRDQAKQWRWLQDDKRSVAGEASGGRGYLRKNGTAAGKSDHEAVREDIAEAPFESSAQTDRQARPKSQQHRVESRPPSAEMVRAVFVFRLGEVGEQPSAARQSKARGDEDPSP